MRVALITALPPSGGAGAARVQSPRPPARRAARGLTVRVNSAEVDANFAFRPDTARDLRYSPPILKGRILR